MCLYDPDHFGGKTRGEFVSAMRAEGITCSPGYERPLTDEGALKTIMDRYPEKVRRNPCPNIEHACAHSVWFFQSMLLGSQEDLDDIIDAVKKVQSAFRG